jgi:hypothetical protein
VTAQALGERHGGLLLLRAQRAVELLSKERRAELRRQTADPQSVRVHQHAPARGNDVAQLGRLAATAESPPPG